jgi:hypothetical protein
MVLIATDLPDPVVPAIKRWGILARLATMGSPPMSLPRASGSRRLLSPKSRAARISRSTTFSRVRVRQFDADHAAARHGGHARRQRRHATRDVVGQTDHAAGLQARGGFQFVHGDDRAGADARRSRPSRRSRPAPIPASGRFPPAPRRTAGCAGWWPGSPARTAAAVHRPARGRQSAGAAGLGHGAGRGRDRTSSPGPARRGGGPAVSGVTRGAGGADRSRRPHRRPASERCRYRPRPRPRR